MQILFLAIAIPVLAAEPGQSLVVSPDGDDANVGSLLKPWKTLAKAAESVRPGDTVFIRTGEYAAGTLLRRSGTAKRTIVLRNFPGERPKINGHGKSRFGLVLDTVRFVQVRGLEVREIKTPHPRSEDILHEQGAILLRESSDCVIAGNLIATGGLPGYTEDNPGATGIQLWSKHENEGGKGCHRNVIRGNDISKSASTSPAGTAAPDTPTTAARGISMRTISRTRSKQAPADVA